MRKYCIVHKMPNISFSITKFCLFVQCVYTEGNKGFFKNFVSLFWKGWICVCFFVFVFHGACMLCIISLSLSLSSFSTPSPLPTPSKCDCACLFSFFFFVLSILLIVLFLIYTLWLLLCLSHSASFHRLLWCFCHELFSSFSESTEWNENDWSKRKCN